MPAAGLSCVVDRLMLSITAKAIRNSTSDAYLRNQTLIWEPLGWLTRDLLMCDDRMFGDSPSQCYHSVATAFSLQTMRRRPEWETASPRVAGNWLGGGPAAGEEAKKQREERRDLPESHLLQDAAGASWFEAKPNVFPISSWLVNACVKYLGFLGVALSHGAFLSHGIPGVVDSLPASRIWGRTLVGMALFLFGSLSPSYQFRQRVRKTVPSLSGPWNAQGFKAFHVLDKGPKNRGMIGNGLG
ncbi:hypothetical protein AAE478_000153 [Parahypoxylon ruwenzoriense]